MPRGRGDKTGTIYNVRHKNLWRPKNRPNFFRDFWQLSTLISNISGIDQRVKNRKSSWSSTAPPTLGEKNLAYFGPQAKKLLTLISVHPNALFSRDYISALRGCCAMKSLHELEIDKNYLEHTPTGTGVSRGDKIGTIFTMLAPKNLWRPKNRPKFFAIFDNFRLWSRISPERINISKIGKAFDHLKPLPR